ncbi:acetylxylan esterase [Chitinophaga sp. YIM B06452]|uniref:alpha/beta hydrolase family protein n=1 Tax=Chitinophaga sp. YIM B06452 TaxID=3082158 RepID=UPI0031FF370C
MAAQAQNAQQDLNVTGNWMQYTDAPNSLYHHLAAEAFTYLDKRAKEVAALHSPNDWQQRQQWLRRILREAVGAFPERTPLNAKVTGVTRKDNYRVENIIYESVPGLYVTGSLFIPGGLKKGAKAPAVVYCSGHSATGYRSPAYQRVMLNLVKKGFIVFAFDPVGQGERLEYYDTTARKSRHKWPSNEHSYPGAQVFMTGNTLAMYMIWDGIRAVDFLLSRKETDPERIAITGRSGGGTQSAYIAAFDDRIKVVAPENYITSFTRLFQSIGPQDAEQNFFHGIARGLDMSDLLMVRAPRPALMITTTRDMFSIQGSTEAAAEVSALYAAYGEKENFMMVTDDAPHASTKKNREALYAFLQKHLHQPGTPHDEEVQPLSPQELQVTPTGQVHTSMKGETIFSLNFKTAQKKHEALLAARKQIPAYLPALLESAKKLSGYRDPGTGKAPVFTGRLQREGYMIEKFFLEGEGNYVIPYLLMKPAVPNSKAILWLNPAGKAADAVAGGAIEKLVKEGFTVLAPDLVGTGETGPGKFIGDSYIDSISYNLWFASIQTARSITGIRAGDVVRLTRLLGKTGIKEIYGIALDEMSPVLLHAAAFEKNITRVALLQPCTSWHSIVSGRIFQSRFVQGAVAGAAGVYDLPDLAASLAPRRLLIAGAVDGNGQPLAAETPDQELVTAAYRDNNSQLKTTPAGNVQDALAWWLKD